MTAMTAAQVDRLLAAPVRSLDSWARTIRNGIEAARRDGRTRYIGTTALRYFVTDDAAVAEAAAVKFVAYGDGAVVKAGG